jgi:hypothetical protein
VFSRSHPAWAGGRAGKTAQKCKPPGSNASNHACVRVQTIWTWGTPHVRLCNTLLCVFLCKTAIRVTRRATARCAAFCGVGASREQPLRGSLETGICVQTPDALKSASVDQCRPA